MVAHMKHWIVKQEPSSYSWDDFIRDGGTSWTGVRNHEARNNLAKMAAGDPILFYHSGKEKAVVGLAAVAREAYRDPTSEEERWVAVDLKPLRPLGIPVGLEAIKGEPSLKDLSLLRNSRLSVSPLSKEAFQTILSMGGSAQRKKETRRAQSKKPK